MCERGEGEGGGGGDRPSSSKLRLRYLCIFIFQQVTSVGGVKVSIVAFQAIDPGSIPG